MTVGVTSKMWLRVSWYLILLVGLNGYAESIDSLLPILALWTLFIVLDLFFSKRKITIILKAAMIMFILYRSGEYGSIYNPIWIYNMLLQGIDDFRYLYFGEFSAVQSAPIILNIVFFFIFKKLIFEKTNNLKYTLFVTFSGSGLLMALSLVQNTKFSILTLLFIFIGLLKLMLDNLEQNSQVIHSDRFLFTVILMIFVTVVLSRSMSVPVSLSGQFGNIRFGMENGLGNDRSRSRPRLSGYYSNDLVLGGPIELSDRHIFNLYTEIPMYLRGESKYYYTGTGWTDAIISEETVPSDNIPVRMYPGVTYQDINVKVEVINSNFPLIFSGIGTTRVDVARGNDIILTNETDLLTRFQIIGGDTYEAVLKYPTYSYESLRSMAPYRSDFAYEQYTQLPDVFPESVKALATQITEGHSNNYDKAMALRNYLTGRDFQYNLDVPFPPSGMDFVEHFLTIKEGYCVHYSTAFVVMARSVGIPARWVKGYTGGSRTGQNQYAVTNVNAHAWAEVYLPDAGWVSFEPTPGFSRRITIQGDNSAIEDPSNPGEGDEVEDPTDSDPTDEIENPVGDETQAPSTDKKRYELFGLILVAISLVGTFSFFNERRIENKLTPNQRITRLYNKIILNMRVIGLDKESGETPREYLTRLNQKGKISTRHLSTLTDEFESVYYGEKEIEVDEYQQLKNKQKEYSTVRLIFLQIKNVLRNRIMKR